MRGERWLKGGNLPLTQRKHRDFHLPGRVSNGRQSAEISVSHQANYRE